MMTLTYCKSFAHIQISVSKRHLTTNLFIVVNLVL